MGGLFAKPDQGRQRLFQPVGVQLQLSLGDAHRQIRSWRAFIGFTQQIIHRIVITGLRRSLSRSKIIDKRRIRVLG